MTHWSAWAAITKYHRLGGLNNKHFYLTVLGAGKSQIAAPVCLVSGETPLPGSLAVVLCVLMWWKGGGMSLGSLKRAQIQFVTTLMT